MLKQVRNHKSTCCYILLDPKSVKSQILKEILWYYCILLHWKQWNNTNLQRNPVPSLISRGKVIIVISVKAVNYKVSLSINWDRFLLSTADSKNVPWNWYEPRANAPPLEACLYLASQGKRLLSAVSVSFSAQPLWDGVAHVVLLPSDTNINGGFVGWLFNNQFLNLCYVLSFRS